MFNGLKFNGLEKNLDPPSYKGAVPMISVQRGLFLGRGYSGYLHI